MNRRGFFGLLMAVPVGIAAGIRPAIAAGIEGYRTVTNEINVAGLSDQRYRSAHRELMQAFEVHKNQVMKAAQRAVENRK